MPPAGHSAAAAATPTPTAAAAAAATATPEAPAEAGPAAGGWAAMYGVEEEDEAAGGGGAAAAEWDVSPAPTAKAEEGGSDGGGLPLDAEGSLPFFFLDAFENMDGRPGEGGGGWGGLVREGGLGVREGDGVKGGGRGGPQPTRPPPAPWRVARDKMWEG